MDVLAESRQRAWVRHSKSSAGDSVQGSSERLWPLMAVMEDVGRSGPTDFPCRCLRSSAPV